MTKREAELLNRIAELEKRVKDLEARPATKQEYHYHYTQPAPYYIPQPYIVPQYPTWLIWTGGAISSGSALGQTTTTSSSGSVVYAS